MFPTNSGVNGRVLRARHNTLLQRPLIGPEFNTGSDGESPPPQQKLGIKRRKVEGWKQKEILERKKLMKVDKKAMGRKIQDDQTMEPYNSEGYNEYETDEQADKEIEDIGNHMNIIDDAQNQRRRQREGTGGKERAEANDAQTAPSARVKTSGLSKKRFRTERVDKGGRSQKRMHAVAQDENKGVVADQDSDIDGPEAETRSGSTRQHARTAPAKECTVARTGDDESDLDSGHRDANKDGQGLEVDDDSEAGSSLFVPEASTRSFKASIARKKQTRASASTVPAAVTRSVQKRFRRPSAVQLARTQGQAQKSLFFRIQCLESPKKVIDHGERTLNKIQKHIASLDEEDDREFLTIIQSAFRVPGAVAKSTLISRDPGPGFPRQKETEVALSWGPAHIAIEHLRISVAAVTDHASLRRVALDSFSNIEHQIRVTRASKRITDRQVAEVSRECILLLLAMIKERMAVVASKNTATATVRSSALGPLQGTIEHSAKSQAISSLVNAVTGFVELGTLIAQAKNEVDKLYESLELSGDTLPFNTIMRITGSIIVELCEAKQTVEVAQSLQGAPSELTESQRTACHSAALKAIQDLETAISTTGDLPGLRRYINGRLEIYEDAIGRAALSEDLTRQQLDVAWSHGLEVVIEMVEEREEEPVEA